MNFTPLPTNNTSSSACCGQLALAWQHDLRAMPHHRSDARNSAPHAITVARRIGSRQWRVQGLRHWPDNRKRRPTTKGAHGKRHSAPVASHAALRSDTTRAHASTDAPTRAETWEGGRSTTTMRQKECPPGFDGAERTSDACTHEWAASAATTSAPAKGDARYYTSLTK